MGSSPTPGTAVYLERRWLMLISLVPLLTAIIGFVLWLVSNNAKVSEAGKIMFFCGLLALMFSLAKETVRFGSLMDRPAPQLLG